MAGHTVHYVLLRYLLFQLARMSPGPQPGREPSQSATAPQLFQSESLTDSLLHDDGGRRASFIRSKCFKVTLCVLFTVALAAAIAAGILSKRQGSVRPPALSPYQRACSVFCQGRLLASLQSAGLWNDSKKFVDMPLTVDPEEVLQAFAESFPSGNPSRDEIQTFVDQYFWPVGSDSSLWRPEDWEECPPQLCALSNASLRSFALDLNDLWLQLGCMCVCVVFDGLFGTGHY